MVILIKSDRFMEPRRPLKSVLESEIDDVVGRRESFIRILPRSCPYIECFKLPLKVAGYPNPVHKFVAESRSLLPCH
jgi:hypothetical protein